jgi:hypothetical protein
VSPTPHQLDGHNYNSSLEFQPLRFENVEEDAVRKSFTTADPQYMAFGLGRISALVMTHYSYTNTIHRTARVPRKIFRWKRAEEYDGASDPQL